MLFGFVYDSRIMSAPNFVTFVSTRTLETSFLILSYHSLRITLNLVCCYDVPCILECFSTSRLLVVRVVLTHTI